MLVVGRLLGEIVSRFGQPAVMGQLLGGIILGPSIFGALAPNLHHLVFPNTPEQKKMIDAVSQLGVLMLLLLTGMETDLALVKRMRKTAFFTSLGGIILPFSCGFLLGEMLPESMLPDPTNRLVTSLFLATALSISSVKIVAMVLIEVDFLRRNIGQIMLASAILDDTIGWIIIALISGIAQTGKVDVTSIGVSLAGTTLFLGVSFTIGKRFVSNVIRWTNDKFTVELPVITAILVITFAMALLTDFIGVHTVLGAFIAGILIGESPILTKHIEEQLKGLIVAFYMPIFFAVAGLSIDLTALRNLTLVELGIGLILIASFGKLVGCYVGGRLGSLTSKESTAVAIGMNARGSTEVIIASIGLAMGVLSGDLFTLIVVMAIVTTMITPPLLRWALLRIPPSGEEKERLEREEAEAKEFISTVDRVLIAVDKSIHGQTASLFAGLVTGSRKMISTVIEIDEVQKKEQPLTEVVKESADKAAQIDDRVGATGKESVSAKPAPNNASLQETAEHLLKEAQKGYELAIVGVDQNKKKKHRLVIDLIDEFEGISVIVIGRERPDKSSQKNSSHPLKILVPTTGTDYSRHGAELAVLLAKGTSGSVSALHVTSTDTLRAETTQKLLKSGRHYVRDIKKLGERQGVPVKTMVNEHRSVEEEILRSAKEGSYDLLVLGVKKRPGAEFFFGSHASAIIERATCSVMIVIS